MSRTACATCGETGIGHDGFACRDCDGQGSTPPTQPPAPTEATARAEDVISGFMRDLAAEQGNRIHGWGKGTSRQLMAALAEAGLVIVKRGDVSDALWAIGSRQTNDKDTIAAYERLSDALAARQPEGVRDGE